MDGYATLPCLPQLDAIIHETLRIHPVLPAMIKVCTQERNVCGIQVIITQVEPIQTNGVDIHHDPQYLPNLEMF